MGKKGKVFLVGAGPGEAGLITLRAVDRIRRAEVLVYDHLLDPQTLGYAPDSCEKIYVGKQASRHTVPQAEINRILLRKALEGRRVVRLKGGDPYVFGRGGEEALFLWENGVEFEVVPGVTSAVAAPCLGGIPVTHRDFASSFHVIAGNRRDGNSLDAIDWHAVARLDGTLIFLMGLANLDAIARHLIQYGMSPETGAAVVSQAGSARQATVRGTLSSIAEETARRGAASPAVFVVGAVTSLAPQLGFYERQPLFGRTVLLTGHDMPDLSRRLSEQGTRVVSLPITRIVPVQDGLAPPEEPYTWIVFTSRHAVDIFFQRLLESGRDARSLSGVRIGAVGRATAGSVLRYGIQADAVPETETAAGLAQCLLDRISPHDRILFPRAETVSGTLADTLRRVCPVTEHVLYRTSPDEGALSRARQILPETDAVFLASASAVSALAGCLNDYPQVEIVSIGPSTSRRVRELGLREPVQAVDPSEEAAADAVTSCLTRRNLNC